MMSFRRPPSGSKAEAWSAAGMGLVLAFFIATSAVAWFNVQVLRDNNQQIIHTHQVIVAVAKRWRATRSSARSGRATTCTCSDFRGG